MNNNTTNNTSPSSSQTILIPCGFVARQHLIENNAGSTSSASDNPVPLPVRLYCNEITLDSSVFIIKSQTNASKKSDKDGSSSLVSIVHIDQYSNKFRLQDFEHELNVHQKDDDSRELLVWRCHNMPSGREQKLKTREMNQETEDMWNDIKDKYQSSHKNCLFSEINVHETASISFSDQSPQLFKIQDQNLLHCPITLKLLQSIKLLNELVIQNDKENEKEKDTTNNGVSLIYNNGWIQEEIEKIKKINDLALPILEIDPNNSDKFIKPLEKQLSSIELNNFKNRLFDAINIIRNSNGKSNIKLTKVGANDNCLCKSGKKFKKCHGDGGQKVYYSY